MNTLEAIANRKSVRTYTGEPITADQMQAILKAANEAPVAMGRYEAVHLTRIENPALLAEIDETAAKAFSNPDRPHPLYGAPAMILVSSAAEGGKLNNMGYSNAAIVVQNMALAATELGVGACHIWGAVMVINKTPALLEKLQLPAGFVPCCAIILGKTAEDYAPRNTPAGRIATAEIL